MSQDIESAEVIRDLIRGKMESGEWTAVGALSGLQTVFTLMALDMEIPLEVILKAITFGFEEAVRS